MKILILLALVGAVIYGFGIMITTFSPLSLVILFLVAKGKL